ncbi:MAG: glycosyltransferase family 39 protein, partial [Myxococcota bacterium]
MGPWRNAPWGLWLPGLVYAALILPTLGRQGIDWDAPTDLLAATSYLAPGGLWTGSPLDPINVRLPMYLGGLLFRLTGPELLAARALSCAAGLATLCGVWIWCRRDFGRRAATLACLLLATSPYFLAYSRLAFSNGDVFIACAVAWVLVAASHFDARPRPARAAGLGFALGMALSSKISALALAPALTLWLLLRGHGDGRTPQAP